MQGLYSAAGLAAGVGLFLFGMGQLTGGLQQAAGERMQGLLRCVTGGPLRGLVTGALVTAALQSSSAAVVLVVGFVSAGVLELPQALPVLFGANVGTTLTAQLLALDLGWLGRPALAAGFLLAVLARGERGRGAGRGVFGFGMLFEGIRLMESTLAPLARAPAFRRMLEQVGQRPGLGLALGLGMTLLAQSSSATVAVLQQAAAQPVPGGTASLLGLAGAVPVLLGDNLGTTVTAWLASLGRGPAARQVAAAHTLFNLSGAVVCLGVLPWFVALVQCLPPYGPETAVIPRQIANAHTLFNLCCAAAWLPNTRRMARLAVRLSAWPGTAGERSRLRR